MTRPTNISHFMTPRRDQPSRAQPRHLLSDAERMARGRAQIADGNYVDIDDVDAYFDSLQRPASEA